MKQSADFFVRSAVTERTTRSTWAVRFLVSPDQPLLSSGASDETGNEPPPHLHYDQDEVYYIPGRRTGGVLHGPESGRCRAGRNDLPPEISARSTPVAHLGSSPVATGRSGQVQMDRY